MPWSTRTHIRHNCMLQKSGVLAAGVFTAAKWVDPQDTEEALDTAAPD